MAVFGSERSIGLIDLRGDRADLFKRSDGLSGDVILSLFEDREGNVWVASTAGSTGFESCRSRPFP